ncbi:uncharacterized protein SAMN04487761_11140 [Lachnospiraceae bacterium C7]|nr:uncharacterized protein SAMN04487761_11140 [Lachnospiraceae bacterium C7]
MTTFTKYFLLYRIKDDNHLLINTFTGALDIVDDKAAKQIEEFSNGDLSAIAPSDPLFNQLKQRGYLFTEKDGEKKLIAKAKAYDDFLYDQSFCGEFIILPTLGCNLRCTYCFEDNDQHINLKEMSMEQLHTILDYISQVKKENHLKLKNKNQKLKIRIFGGEPLLPKNRNIVEEILRFSKANDIEVNIVSNGTLIDFYMDLLTEYRDVLNIQITLDGQKEIHDCRRIKADGSGTFDMICKNINKLIANNIRIALRVNVDADNINGLPDLYKIIQENGWDKSAHILPYASPVVDFSSQSTTTLEESELLDGLIRNGYKTDGSGIIKFVVSPCIGYLNQFFNPASKNNFCKTHYCGATSKTELCFSPDGLITSCLTYSGKGKHSIGHFDENGVYFDKNSYDKWTKRSVFNIPKCKECKYAFVCGGGCPIKALDQNGSMDDTVCSDIKNTIDLYVKKIIIKQLEKRL